MGSFTHVHVIVHGAENLLFKGKNDTNNAFVVIELGRESYRTSINRNSGKSVVWNEECELRIPEVGNKASIVVTAYHRNSLGLDQFLGTAKIALSSLKHPERTIKWYKLEGKPGKIKGQDKPRGKLEVEIDFTSSLKSCSLTSLPSKGKKSIERLAGSLFALRHSEGKTQRRKLATALSRIGLKKKKDLPSTEDLVENNLNNNCPSSKNYNNLDPGVISDEEDSVSHKSSESLSDHAPVSGEPPTVRRRQHFLKNPQISISDWGSKPKLNLSQDSLSSSGNRKHSSKLEHLQGRLADRRLSSSCMDFSLIVNPKPEKKFSSSLNLVKNPTESQTKFSKFTRKFKNFQVSTKDLRPTVEGCADGENSEWTPAKSEFKNKNREELINMVVDLQKRVNCIGIRVNDLENYLDEILVKVMENMPKILEKS